MFRYLCAGALALALIGQAEAQSVVPTSPGQHGAFDFGSNTPGSEGFLTKQMLDSELGNYVTGTALASALAPYLTQTQAASTYQTLSGDLSTNKLNGGALNALSGSGNAFACINASGQLYRSSTACQ